MRLGLVSAGLISISSFGSATLASSLEAYQCVLSHNKPSSEIASSVYYMVLDSSLGSGLERSAVGEFMDSGINFTNGKDIVARISVSDTSQYPSRFKVTLRIVELNGLGEERELASSTFRRGDPNLKDISVQTETGTLAVYCNHLILNKI